MASVVPEEKAAILNKKAFAHIATIGPDGAPQNNPVWVEWDGEYVKFSQTTTRKKVRNLESEPRVAISVYDPDNPYNYVEVRGRLERIEKDPDNAFINKMAKKYIDQDVYPWHKEGDERIVMYVKPEHYTTM